MPPAYECWTGRRNAPNTESESDERSRWVMGRNSGIRGLCQKAATIWCSSSTWSAPLGCAHAAMASAGTTGRKHPVNDARGNPDSERAQPTWGLPAHRRPHSQYHQRDALWSKAVSGCRPRASLIYSRAGVNNRPLSVVARYDRAGAFIMRRRSQGQARRRDAGSQSAP